MAEITNLIYGTKPHIIKRSCYKNFDYFIIKNTYGPCAYVVLNEEPNWDVFELNQPHGGVTYNLGGLDFYINNEVNETLVPEYKIVVGWDFMHADDYMAPPYNSNKFSQFMNGGTVWSLNMIEENVFNTIDEIINKNLQSDVS